MSEIGHFRIISVLSKRQIWLHPSAAEKSGSFWHTISTLENSNPGEVKNQFENLGNFKYSELTESLKSWQNPNFITLRLFQNYSENLWTQGRVSAVYRVCRAKQIGRLRVTFPILRVTHIQNWSHIYNIYRIDSQLSQKCRWFLPF